MYIKLIIFAQLNEILRVLSSTHLAAMASMSMVFEISFSQDINKNDSSRCSIIAVLRHVLISLSLLNVRLSLATVTGAVVRSLYALLVSGNADLKTSESLLTLATVSSFSFSSRSCVSA